MLAGRQLWGVKIFYPIGGPLSELFECCYQDGAQGSMPLIFLHFFRAFVRAELELQLGKVIGKLDRNH